MKLAVYENPQTDRRELWVDGDLKSYVTHELMDFGQPGWGRLVDFWLARPEQWVEGRLMGDPEAIAKEYRPEVVP